MSSASTKTKFGRRALVAPPLQRFVGALIVALKRAVVFVAAGASNRLRTTSPSPLRISTMTPSRCSKRAPPELTRSGRWRPPPTTAQEILHEPLARTSSTSTPPGLPLVRSLKRTPRLPLVRRTLQHGLPLQVPPAGTVAAERGGA